MTISAVMENTSACGLSVEHGLSLWIEACGQKFLFDLGQSGLFAKNARTMGIDIAEAEFAVVSHGHYDHGGGIATFLAENRYAPVFLHANAFTDCYSEKEGRVRYIGLDKTLRENDRIAFVKDEVTKISDGIVLISSYTGRRYFSPANSRILKKIDGRLVPDDFSHEQSLIIEEGERRVLIAGCAHSGILNIMAKAESVLQKPLTDVVSGLHLIGVDEPAFIDGLAHELMGWNQNHNCSTPSDQRPCHYYTCHCTGEDAYMRLKETMSDRLHRLRCGETISLSHTT